MAQEIEHTQVIILGGGITGLAAALYLSQQGVDFILIEKHKGTSIYPRARTIDVRTMELFRGLGLNDTLREAGKSLAPAWGIIHGDNLLEALDNPVGKITPSQLMEAQQEMKALAEKSPEALCRCTQDISEAILSERANLQGSDLRFYHQMLSFKQQKNEVEVLVKNRMTGIEYTIKADYMIAADGANSIVREQLKILTSGNVSGVDLLNIYFQADLEVLVKGREFSQLLIETPEITGFLLTINNKDKWAFHLRYHRETGETLVDYTEEKLIGILHRILGVPDLEVAILAVLPWQLTVKIAEKMRVNRIFLAGDSAHTMTPYAGKGANTGIQDVQNLAWKLAAVLKYQAGDALLTTYHTERHPVGSYYASLSGELAKENGLINDDLMVSKAKDLMGLPNYGYCSTAVRRDAELAFTYFRGEPGTRLPHLWLDPTLSTSSLDWIKGQFVIIASDVKAWQMECDQVKARFNIHIHLISLDEEQIVENWKELTNSRQNEALLVRPDDFIAAKLTLGGLLEVMESILNMQEN